MILGAFHAEALEKYGRRDNFLFSGVVEEQNKNVYQKVVDLVEQIEVTIDKTDITVCHPRPTCGIDPKV